MKSEKKKLSKRVAIMVSIIVILFVVIIGSLLKYKYELSMQFEDTNGDDKTVVKITDEMINKYFEDYRSIKRHVVRKKENDVRISGQYEECDRSYIKTKIGCLSGIYVCNAYMGIGKDVTYSFDSHVEKGNMRIIITDKDSNILYEVPIDQQYEISFMAEDAQEYYVKFIAESAKFEVVVERHE